MSEPTGIRSTAPQTGGKLYDVVSLLGVYLLVVALFVAGWLISDEFLTRQNLMTALQAVALLGIVTVGVSFITYSRHYVDLSIPGIMALSGTVAVWALQYGFAASLAAGLGTGLLIGLINGLVVGYLRLNPIIWTLAMVSVLAGVIRWAYAGKQIYPDKATAAGRAFLQLYHARVFGHVPLIVLLLAVVAIVAHLIMRKTGFGAQLRLTGSAYEVARMTGVNVRRTVAVAFVISALTSAAAGILLTSFNKVGAFYIGQGYDFAAITAVVLGGMTLAGGRGSIVGVIGGVTAIALMGNVMSLVRVGDFVIGEYLKQVIQGAVFILVVGIHSYSLRRSGLDDA
jgi:ribose/xylose/arabinose/galactoside ABC-type transport system permease subunit